MRDLKGGAKAVSCVCTSEDGTVCSGVPSPVWEQFEGTACRPQSLHESMLGKIYQVTLTNCTASGAPYLPCYEQVLGQCSPR